MELIESVKNCGLIPVESRDDLVGRLERIKNECGDWVETPDPQISVKLIRAFEWSETEEGEDFWEDWYLRFLNMGL